jgi:hypothetical protein
MVAYLDRTTHRHEERPEGQKVRPEFFLMLIFRKKNGRPPLADFSELDAMCTLEIRIQKNKMIDHPFDLGRL